MGKNTQEGIRPDVVCNLRQGKDMPVVHWLHTLGDTICGKRRHFTLEIVPVAVRKSDVTCEECRVGRGYDEAS